MGDNKYAISANTMLHFNKEQQLLWQELQFACIEIFLPLSDLKKILITKQLQDRLLSADCSLNPNAMSVHEFVKPLKEKFSVSYQWLQQQISAEYSIEALLSDETKSQMLLKLIEAAQCKARLRELITTKVADVCSAAKCFKIRNSLLKPSDPLSWELGNKMANCTKFGDGKNNFYNISSLCANSVISFSSESMRESAVASSTFWVGKQGLGVIYDKVSQDPLNFSLQSVFGDDFLQKFMQMPYVIVAGNIEGNNDIIQTNDALIKKLYVELSSSMSKQFGGASVWVGSAHNDHLKNLNYVKNHSMPLSPIIYTDAKNRLGEIIQQDISHNEFLTKYQDSLKKSIIPITPEWLLPIAFIQEEVYKDTALNESFIETMHTIQAAQIANQLYGKSVLNKDLNLSSMIFDEQGLPAGYIIAYIAQSEYQHHDEIINKGEQVIYVHDVAVRPCHQNSMMGIRLMLGLLRQWKKIDLPLLADVRRETSYPILQRYAEQGKVDMHVLKDQGDMLKVLLKKK